MKDDILSVRKIEGNLQKVVQEDDISPKRIPDGNLQEVARELALALQSITPHRLAQILEIALEDLYKLSISAKIGCDKRIKEIMALIDELKNYPLNYKIQVIYDSSPSSHPSVVRSDEILLEEWENVVSPIFPLFDNGGWEYNSFNTLFLRQLVKSLPDYNHGEGLSHENIRTLNVVYLRRAMLSRLTYDAKIADEKEAYNSIVLLRLEEEKNHLLKMQEMTVTLVALNKLIDEVIDKKGELEEKNKELGDLCFKKKELINQLNNHETELDKLKEAINQTQHTEEEKKKRLLELFPAIDFSSLKVGKPVSSTLLKQAEMDAILQYHTTIQHGLSHPKDIKTTGFHTKAKALEAPQINAEELKRIKIEKKRLKILRHKEIQLIGEDRRKHLQQLKLEDFDQKSFVNRLEEIAKRLAENQRENQKIEEDMKKRIAEKNRLENLIVNGSNATFHATDTVIREITQADREKYGDEILPPPSIIKLEKSEAKLEVTVDPEAIKIAKKKEFQMACSTIGLLFKPMVNPQAKLPNKVTKKASVPAGDDPGSINTHSRP